MNRNFVAHRIVAAVGFRPIDQRNARIQLIALARLYEEHLWFTRQCRTCRGRKVAPNVVQLVLAVARVNVSHFTVRQNGNENAILVGVIHFGHWKNHHHAADKR